MLQHAIDDARRSDARMQPIDQKTLTVKQYKAFRKRGGETA